MKNPFPIKDVFKERIEENGYTFCAVFDEKGIEPNFIYSISATDKFKAEFIIVGNMNINSLNGLLNTLLVMESLPEPGRFTSKGLQVLVDEKPQELNLELIDVTGQRWLDEVIRNRSDNFNKVYQLCFGDLSNKLPTEKGNKDFFKQLFFQPKLS